MIGALLALALPSIAGLLVVRWADARETMDLPAIALWIGVGMPLGAGLAGVFAWSWLVAGGEIGPVYGWVEALALLAVAVLAWRGRSARGAATWIWPRPTEVVPIAAVALAVGIAAATFLSWAPRTPHGDWDAWAIWNLHARFLARGAGEWRLLFGPELTFSHNDYPLLLPAIVARTWVLAERTVGSAAVAGVFTVAPILALFGAVESRSGPLPGAIAALLLAATPEWMTWGLSQNADVPVGALVLAALACTTLADGERAAGAWRWLLLAGGLVGLAAITKDDGVVYALAVAGWVGVRGGRARALRRVGALAAGFAVALLLRLHFHAALSPSFAGIYTEGQSLELIRTHLLDGARWAQIFSEASGHFPGLSHWLPLVALAVPWSLGARPGGLHRSSALAPALAGYAAYLLAWSVSPIAVNAERLHWHVVTSAPRVLLHPWPALLLALLALVPRREGEDASPGAEVSPGPGA